MAALLAGLALAGCSKSREPKITGSRSAPPVSLQCAWQPGYTYQLHLEMSQVTDQEKPEPNEGSAHRVTFEQECLVKVTEAARSGVLNLEMEILSLAMERSKGGQKTLSFDSDQRGETLDEQGYIPVFERMIGGKLKFQVSTNGNVLRADGISEWIDRAIRAAGPPKVSSLAAMIDDPDNVAPPPVVTKTVRTTNGTVRTSSSNSSSGGTVGNTLRNFFTQDHFKQMLEFPFLPQGPVRVGDRWPAQGDTAITTRGRFRYNGTAEFEGWQTHRGTNCARVSVEGALASAVKPPGKASGDDKTFRATLWVDRELQFPAAMIFEKSTWVQDTAKRTTTNQVAAPRPLKSVQQRVSSVLVTATPPQAEAPTTPVSSGAN